MENDPNIPTEGVDSGSTEPASPDVAVGTPHESSPTDETLIVDDFPEVGESKPPRIKDLLSSSDHPSRFVTLLSLTFGTLALLCVALLTYVIITHRHSKSTNDLDLEHQKVFLEPIIQEPLGFFQVVLKAESGQVHDYDMRVDLVAECSTEEACESLKHKMVEARDLVNPVLSSITREEYLSVEGKNRIRRRIAEQLSGLVQGGKISEIQFTNLTIESGH